MSLLSFIRGSNRLIRVFTRVSRIAKVIWKKWMDCKKEHEELIQKEKLLDGEIKKLSEEMCKKEMHLLHTYNEVKDATQIILAAMAKFEGVTVKTLHERFDLPLRD